MTVSLVKRPQPQGTIWVCTDCMMMRENDESNDDRPDTEPEPWSLEPDTDVTNGLMSAEHDAGCEGDWEQGCACEVQSFSWSQCDACGSMLGGSRYAYTYWA